MYCTYTYHLLGGVPIIQTLFSLYQRDSSGEPPRGCCTFLTEITAFSGTTTRMYCTCGDANQSQSLSAMLEFGPLVVSGGRFRNVYS